MFYKLNVMLCFLQMSYRINIMLCIKYMLYTSDLLLFCIGLIFRIIYPTAFTLLFFLDCFLFFNGTYKRLFSITGFVAGSPREVLREAYKADLISDDAWMKMLKIRNELTHDYDCEIVKEHCNTIVNKYIDLFFDFEKIVQHLILDF